MIFVAEPLVRSSKHFGSRLAFDPEGHLFVTVGERGQGDRAQDPGDHNGSVIRLHPDGRVPEDNPFVGVEGARPEIFSYGHRNPQGLAIHPETGLPWLHEHGARGGDEVNIVRPGVNYGWPVITYGIDYSGAPIGEGTHKEGMAQPIHYWVPSIAPSGMAFYDGEAFPEWQGDLFVGALRSQLLARLELDGERVVAEERLLEGAIGRIRDVEVGPDGYLYLLTDESDGGLYRLEPVAAAPVPLAPREESELAVDSRGCLIHGLREPCEILVAPSTEAYYAHRDDQSHDRCHHYRRDQGKPRYVSSEETGGSRRRGGGSSLRSNYPAKATRSSVSQVTNRIARRTARNVRPS